MSKDTVTTWEAVQFRSPGIDWQEWKDSGFTIKLAWAWGTAQFGVSETKDWLAAGFHDVAKAAAWKAEGFKIDQASDWSAAGFEAAEARPLVVQGLLSSDAALIRKLLGLGLTPAEINQTFARVRELRLEAIARIHRCPGRPPDHPTLRSHP